MATIVANGNRSVTSPAYANTDDGQFEHAFKSATSSYGKGKKASLNYRTGFTKERAMVFGPSTVYDSKGEPWESAHWMHVGEHPVENPDKSSKIRWVTKEHAARIEARMRTEGKKAFNKAYDNTSNAVSGGINKVTGAVGNEIGSMKSAGEAARTQYQRDNMTTSTPKGAPMLTRTYDKNLKNRVGETAAYVRGAVGGSSAAKAVRNEVDNIYKGAIEARNQQRIKNNNYSNRTFRDTLSETAAAVRGGIGASAVGRAGKAAFNGLMDKIKSSREAFEAAIDKYVTGKSAGANRKELLEAGSRLIGQIRGAMGMLGDEGGRQTIGRNIGKGLNTALGTAAGIAGGIAKSKAGSAAIGAGKAVFSKVSSGVGSALDAIKGFFKKKSLSRGAANA